MADEINSVSSCELAGITPAESYSYETINENSYDKAVQLYGDQSKALEILENDINRIIMYKNAQAILLEMQTNLTNCREDITDLKNEFNSSYASSTGDIKSEIISEYSDVNSNIQSSISEITKLLTQIDERINVLKQEGDRANFYFTYWARMKDLVVPTEVGR